MISLCEWWCTEGGETMAVRFKGAHFPQDIILTCVRWYVAYPLSTRHVEELMRERGVYVDHSTINRWVIKYSETGKKWGSSGGLGLFLIPGACIKPDIPTAEGTT